MNNSRKTVLICPLNWGLGHATRSVPIIKKIIDKGFNIIIAADKRPLDFLKEEFPEIKTIVFSGFDVQYSKTNNMVLRMLFNIPKFSLSIFKEHNILKKIIKKYDVDIVISDNRYGLWNKKVFSIFITHQISIKFPKYLKIFEFIFYRLNKFIISKYNECWIPDFEETDNNLSGDLSHKYKLPKKCFFIGPLSRFSLLKNSISDTDTKKYDVLVILSGPEPQRTILQNKIISGLINTNLKAVIVKGITEMNSLNIVNENIKLFSHLNSKDLLKYIKQSKIVVCRSGYSSIMDLTCLGKKAIFIPTPGQTEQEYLADYLHEKKMFYFQSQKEINVVEAIKKSENYIGMSIKNNNNLLDERIEKCYY